MHAKHVATGLEVAIRYATPDAHDGERYREAYRALVDLASPYVAGVYEYVEGSDGVAVVREYVDGLGLRALLAAGRALEPAAALTVLKGGLSGLAAGHAEGLAHHAYRPENLVIDQDGRARLTDFGPGKGDPAVDLAAAAATFGECVTGRAGATPGDLPKRLRVRPLTATPGDAATMLAELAVAARAVCGERWESKGRTILLRRLGRAVRRG